MSILIPPVQAALWFAAQQAAAQRGRRGRPGPSVPLWLAGGTLAAGGAALGIGALTAFVRARTTWHPQNAHEASVLVTTGPNAVTRNPMYLAMALALAGTGLASPRPWTAVAALGLMSTLTPQIRREERALASIFGQEYAAYRRRVRRWL